MVSLLPKPITTLITLEVIVFIVKYRRVRVYNLAYIEQGL